MDKQQSEGRRKNAAVPDSEVIERTGRAGAVVGKEPSSFRTGVKAGEMAKKKPV